MKPAVILCSPHSRNDVTEEYVRENLPDRSVVRVRGHEELVSLLGSTIDVDWIFFPHWSWKIPSSIHEHFKCVIFHMTSLPYGRGGSPLQNLIIRGHRDTLLSAIACTGEVDGGPIYFAEPLSLDGTAEKILRDAAVIAGRMILRIVLECPRPVEQWGKVVKFARRTPDQGNVGGLSDLNEVYDYIRMLDATGYPNAFVEVGRFRFEFVGAKRNGDTVTAKVTIRRKSGL